MSKPTILVNGSRPAGGVAPTSRPPIALRQEMPSIGITGIIFAIDEFWDSGLFWDDGGHWDEGVAKNLPAIGVVTEKPSIAVT